MKKINQMKMILDSCSVNEGFSRVAVSAFASQLDMTVDEESVFAVNHLTL